MGRKGSRLVPFLKEGLMLGTFGEYLEWKDKESLVFILHLPHKTVKMTDKPQLILHHWYRLKDKKYIYGESYTEAKQGMIAALRRSDFVSRIDASEDRLVYRILSDCEVYEKKNNKKEIKRKRKQALSLTSPLSVGSSGYGSGNESPPSAINPLNEKALQAVAHDHADYPKLNLNELFFVPPSEDEGIVLYSDAFMMDDCICSNIYEEQFATAEIGDVKMECSDTSHQLACNAGMQLVNSETSELTSMAYIDSKNNSNIESNENACIGIPVECVPTMDTVDTITTITSDTTRFPLLSMHDELPLNMLDFPQIGSSFVSLDDLLEIPFEPLLNPSDDELLTSALKEFDKDLVASAMASDAIADDVPRIKTERIYVFKKCEYLGNVPVLDCEPKERLVPDDGKKDDGLQILLDETALRMIEAHPIKDYKIIGENLLIILQPAI